MDQDQANTRQLQQTPKQQWKLLWSQLLHQATNAIAVKLHMAAKLLALKLMGCAAYDQYWPTLDEPAWLLSVLLASYLPALVRRIAKKC
jgi:hypothetical protein